MSRINFLPASFERIRKRQQRRPVEFAVIGGTAVVLVALWLYTAGPDTALARQSDKLDQQLKQIEPQQAEQARLRETNDWREGVAAMAERRTPYFTGI